MLLILLIEFVDVFNIMRIGYTSTSNEYISDKYKLNECYLIWSGIGMTAADLLQPIDPIHCCNGYGRTIIIYLLCCIIPMIFIPKTLPMEYLLLRDLDTIDTEIQDDIIYKLFSID